MISIDNADLKRYAPSALRRLLPFLKNIFCRHKQWKIISLSSSVWRGDSLLECVKCGKRIYVDKKILKDNFPRAVDEWLGEYGPYTPGVLLPTQLDHTPAEEHRSWTHITPEEVGPAELLVNSKCSNCQHNLNVYFRLVNNEALTIADCPRCLRRTVWSRVKCQ
jgi:hypothetical protein